MQNGYRTSSDNTADTERLDIAGTLPRVGERFSRRVTLDADSIRTFASLCGDHNPLHHDAQAAAAGPFGALIASGPHVVALMMGLDATSLSARGNPAGR